MLLALGEALSDSLGAPAPMLRVVGGVLLAWAIALGVIATRREVSRRAVTAVVVLNLAWVAASLAVAAGAWVPLTRAGVLADVAQAVAVLGLAGAEAVGLYRLAPADRS